MLILYTLILLYLIYQAYRAWETPAFVVFIALISLWTGGVWALSRIYDWLFHENQELEQKRKKERRAHQKDLIDTVIKPWYEHNTMSLTNEPFAMEHLRKGYPIIRKLWFKESNKLKTQILEDKKKIREYIKKRSMEGIPLYSKLDDIYDEGYMYQNESTGEVFEEVLTCMTGDEIYELVVVFIKTGNLTKDEEYKELVETIVNDRTLFKLYKKLYKNTNQLNENVYEFEQHLKKIVHDFEKIGRELKGRCDDC